MEELLDRYVVCTNHFKEQDYRNPLSKCLNTTAIPAIQSDLVEKSTPLKSPQGNIIVLSTSILPKLGSCESDISLSKPSNALNARITVENSATNLQSPLEKSYVRLQKRKKRTSEEVQEELWRIKRLALQVEALKKNSTASSVQEEDVGSEVTVNEQPPSSAAEEQVLVEETKQSPTEIEEQPLLEELEQIEVVEESIQIKEFNEASMQTETLEDEQTLSQIYATSPQFESMSRLDLINDIKAKEAKIKDLETKLEKFSSAMNAFKMLMNS